MFCIWYIKTWLRIPISCKHELGKSLGVNIGIHRLFINQHKFVERDVAELTNLNSWSCILIQQHQLAFVYELYQSIYLITNSLIDKSRKRTHRVELNQRKQIHNATKSQNTFFKINCVGNPIMSFFYLFYYELFLPFFTLLDIVVNCFSVIDSRWLLNDFLS